MFLCKVEKTFYLLSWEECEEQRILNKINIKEMLTRYHSFTISGSFSTVSTLSGTMITFLPLEFLSVSHRIPWKNKSAVYHFANICISSENIKFEKWVKYANEVTDDITLNIKYIIELSWPICSAEHWNLAGW